MNTGLVEIGLNYVIYHMSYHMLSRIRYICFYTKIFVILTDISLVVIIVICDTTFFVYHSYRQFSIAHSGDSGIVNNLFCTYFKNFLQSKKTMVLPQFPSQQKSKTKHEVCREIGNFNE